MGVELLVVAGPSKEKTPPPLLLISTPVKDNPGVVHEICADAAPPETVN